MHTDRFSPPASSDGEENGDSPEVSLTIRAVDGRQAYLQVSHSIQISALCELVALEFNESVERVRLIYRGKRLKPEDRLAQYIPRSAADEPHCLHVVFRVPPPESGQHSVVDESGRSSSGDAPASEERGRNAALFSHALPTGLLMDTFRLGPTAQFSVTAAGDNAGNGQGSLLTSPSFLQSLMSSLASAAVNGSTGNSTATRAGGASATAGASNDERAEERRSASRVPHQETTPRQPPAAADRSAQQDTSSSLPRSFAVQQTFPDFPSSSSMPLHHEAPPTEPPATGTARVSDGSTTRPQQVRVTVGSLPVTLGGTGLSQIFHSVLGQLANPGNNDTTQPSAASRSRPSPSRRRISTAFSDFSLRNAHLTSNTAPPAEEASSRVGRDTSAFRRMGDAQHPVTPGLSSFLRRTVNVLAESRRGVTQASETILETLEEALTQSSAEGSNRLIHAGATSAAPLQSVGGAPNGSQTRQQQQQPESVWISNESISEELPWSTLHHLAQILRRATGWQLPELTPNAERSSPLDSSPPLARFLLSFQQLTSMSVALLTQVEAWQRGSGRLGIADVGHCVQVFALSSSIQASLAALFSWLFFHLARHVDSSTLFDRMQWSSSSADQPPSRHRAFTTVRHTEEDDDAFVDAHESPTVEPSPPPTSTIPPEGPAEPEVGDATSSTSSSSLSDEAKALSSSSSRKRPNEEDQFSEVSSCSAVSVTPDIPIDDASAVKKQRTTDSPLHTKKKNSDTSGPQSSNALTNPGVLADTTSRSSNGFSQSVAHVASSNVNPLLPSFFPMPQLQQAAAAPSQRSSDTAAATTTVVSRLPISVRERYERWTSDPVQFSRAVIAQARRMRPLSDAYLSGTPGSNVSQEQSDVQAVGPLFGIRWRQAASRVNVPQESIESVSQNLDRTYVLVLLKELVDQARANPDFQEEPQRYRYIREAMRRLRDEEHNTAKD